MTFDTLINFCALPFLVLICVAYVYDAIAWDEKDIDMPVPVQALYMTCLILAFVGLFTFLVSCVIAISGSHEVSLIVDEGVALWEVPAILALIVSIFYHKKARRGGGHM